MDRLVYKYLKSVTESIEEARWRARSGGHFFSNVTLCPYCVKDTEIVYRNSRTIESPPEDKHEWFRDEESVQVNECADCGWWFVSNRTDHEDNDSDDYRWSALGYRRAVLEVHNLCSPKIPIDALARELVRRGDSVHGIHHRAMERLVEGVMREHYPGCSVELCGRGADGGVDLYVVRGDVTIGIQVKRRKSRAAVESVSTVREFFGAGVAKHLLHLIFITTADRFSGSPRGAQAFARQVVDDRIVDSFDLIDRDRFIGMLDLMMPGPLEQPWRPYIL